MFLVAVRTQQDGIANEPMNPRQISDNAGWNFPIRLGALDDDHRDHGALPQCGTFVSKRSAANSNGNNNVGLCLTARRNLAAVSTSAPANADGNGAVQVAKCGE
jgi:hypothetical protein